MGSHTRFDRLDLWRGGWTPAQLPAFDPHAFDEMQDGVLRSYLRVQDALVHGEADVARAALRDLASRAESPLAELAHAAAAGGALAPVRQGVKPRLCDSARS